MDNNIIRAATIEKLVERATTEKYTDHNYVMEFLMTYRQFTTPMALADLLIKRYCQGVLCLILTDEKI
jgi:hypothetical protein